MKKIRQLQSIKGGFITNPEFDWLFERGNEINRCERNLFRILNRPRIRSIMDAAHYPENFDRFKNNQP